MARGVVTDDSSPERFRPFSNLTLFYVINSILIKIFEIIQKKIQVFDKPLIFIPFRLKERRIDNIPSFLPRLPMFHVLLSARKNYKFFWNKTIIPNNS